MHPIREMIEKGKTGIPSFCTANPIVLEAVMEYGLQWNRPVLVEATANQVNQFGGYTGIQPEDFKAMVERIADRTGLLGDKVLLGGDHLGPLIWKKEPENSAMEKAEQLVEAYVSAGFLKIHLDTSMKLGDDPDGPLPTEVVAKRGARLCRAAERAFERLKAKDPKAEHPIYIIGSEVPVPGGTQEAEDSVAVTRPEDFEETVRVYQEIFKEHGLWDSWQYVLAVVVQPGVEFGDFGVLPYDRKAAGTLTKALKKYPQLVLEGHSTDYQTRMSLREMVEDGVAVLKVGPALTFALREALFALSMMEKELIPEEKRAYFQEVLEREMLKHPGNWEPYYHGDFQSRKIARRYSYSDRARYYLSGPEVSQAVDKLFQNLDTVRIPDSMIHQYMPGLFRNAFFMSHERTARNMAKSAVIDVALDYDYGAYGPSGKIK